MILILVGLLTCLCCFSSAEESTEQALPTLQLKPAELQMNKGTGAKVTPNVANLPKGVRAQKYEWTSSNPEVAEFSKGTIRGIGGGQAVMTCTAILSDGTTLSADCPVSVRVPVTKTEADLTPLTVMAGDPVTWEITVFPEDATNPKILFSTSNDQVLSVEPDGRVTALAEGKADLIAVSEDNPARKLRVPVTVSRRIGITDRELTFLGIPWESDSATCIELLKEKGFVAQDARDRSSFTGTAWHWPENDLLFSRLSSWRSLPISFSDSETGAGRTSLKPEKTVGGYMPQTATLIYLNGIGEDGRIDPDSTRLIGVYFNFDNRHEKGTTIFCELLKRLEEQYGEFRRYLSKDFTHYYPEVYRGVEEVMIDPREYTAQEPETGDAYLGEYVICTMHGADHTGIMLNLDTNESVTLFYGRTDAPELIGELKQHMDDHAEAIEDIGV